jgi:uroporphyrin-III C-methyltransferase / precorrin-2 dehydrogenase / sirohydrochlorin ferrochelatase
MSVHRLPAPRLPSEARSTRMGRLSRLPVFFALDGKRAMVSGGNAAAAWKVELLSAAGATVDVYAAQVADELLALASDPPRGIVNVHSRDWTAEDFNDAAIAVGVCDTENEAHNFSTAARVAGVPVNVIDKPDFCDFSFGAIVNRSPLVIGISTDGAAPVFAQAIRAKLEGLLPKGFAQWAEAAARWRSALTKTELTFAGRRKFWQLFTARAVANPGREPVQADFSGLMAEIQVLGPALERGTVTLVGAGPGDPELLTLRAVRALQSADVILFDDLVSREVLDFARREARKMLVGKTGHGPSCTQADINALMIKLAKSGKRVVRLKGGDPLIFGRAGEEIDVCKTAGIPVDVVPGITAAQGAASSLCISLTDRNHARRVQYVTGHAKDGKLPVDLDWHSFADPAVTTAIYMPTGTLAELVDKAVAQGLDPSTPAIAIARATRPDQAIIADCISNLPARLAQASLRGPVTVLLGGVCLDALTRSTPDTARAPAR